MFLSSDALPDDCELSGHLAVVGAGPAGIVIALKAARGGLDVLLIESGAETFDPRVQQLSEASSWDPRRHAPMSMSARRQLGGTSTIWGGRCVPYDRVDFDRRPYISETPWPVSYDELLPYFQRACDWLHCGRAAFDVTGMTHVAGSIVPGLVAGDASTATFERWSLAPDFGREYSDALRRSDRVRVVTGLTCTEVLIRDDGARVDRLACRTLEGRRVRVRAASYVLACGGLETTRLLLASHGRDGRPPGDHSGHLGAWYMAHVGGVIAKVRFAGPPRATIFGYERDLDGTYLRRRFSISRDTQLDRELPNVIAQLANPELADGRHRNGVLSLAYLALRSPLGTMAAPAAQRFSVAGSGVAGPAGGGAAAGDAVVRWVGDGAVSAADAAATGGAVAGAAAGAPLWPHLVNVARDGVSVARYAAAFGGRRFLVRGHRTPALFAAYSRENLYPLQYHGEQIPSRQSQVSLSGDRDALGMPRLNISLRYSQCDVDGIIRCHQVWDEYLRRNGRGRLEYISDDPGSMAWSRMAGGSHQLGTTRMAARARDGVVDEHLAVHGVPNLAVASSSAFLTASQANPTFMIVVFALRLADRLTSSLRAVQLTQPERDELARKTMPSLVSSGPAIAARSKLRQHPRMQRAVMRALSLGRSGDEYERSFRSALLGCVRPGDCVWDVGANVGLYSELFAAAVGPSGRVVSFEPSRACVDMLTRRRDDGGIGAPWDIVPVALSDADGEAWLSVAAGETAPSNRLAGRNEAGVIAVRACRGDSLVAAGYAEPAVIKIDVEGHEGEVLDGMAALLGGSSLRAIGAEIHFGAPTERGKPHEPARIIRLLQAHDFTIRWVDRSHCIARR